MKTTLQALSLGLSIALLSACGSAGGKDEANGEDSPEASAGSTSALLSDESLASESVSSSVDEAISGAAEASASGNDAGAMAFALDEAPLSGKAKALRHRACAVEGDKAIVSVKRLVDRSMAFDRGGRSGSVSFKDLFEAKLSWSKEGGTVACSENGKHAAIDKQALEGHSLAASFKIERSRSSSFSDRKGRTSAREASIKAEGSREIAWSDVVVEGDVVKLTTSVKSSVKREVATINKKGEAVSLSSQVRTDDAAPLVVLIERSKDDGLLLSRTLVSGKKIATGKDGGRIETVFKEVKYVRGDGCYPLSGSIEGAVYAKDAATAGATYVVNFSGSAKTMAFTMADGTKKEAEYVAEGCAFESEQVEESAGSVEEKASAAEVK